MCTIESVFTETESESGSESESKTESESETDSESESESESGSRRISRVESEQYFSSKILKYKSID